MKGNRQVTAACPFPNAFVAPSRKIFKGSDPKADQQLTVKCDLVRWLVDLVEKRQNAEAQSLRSSRENGPPVGSSCSLPSVRHPAGAQVLVVAQTQCRLQVCRLLRACARRKKGGKEKEGAGHTRDGRTSRGSACVVWQCKRTSGEVGQTSTHGRIDS